MNLCWGVSKIEIGYKKIPNFDTGVGEVDDHPLPYPASPLQGVTVTLAPTLSSYPSPPGGNGLVGVTKKRFPGPALRFVQLEPWHPLSLCNLGDMDQLIPCVRDPHQLLDIAQQHPRRPVQPESGHRIMNKPSVQAVEVSLVPDLGNPQFALFRRYWART